MALKSIQLAHLDPIDRATGEFSVTVHSNDSKLQAEFHCTSEHDAKKLRDAIRDYASELRDVAGYRL